jgi:hypothetical protein
MTKGRQIRYSSEELAWIEERKEHTRRDLHELFVAHFDRPEVTEDHIKALCTRRGWKTGRTGQFPKGAIPPNKGKKGQCAPGSEKGWFKKGQMPSTYRGHGHEYVDNKDGYVLLILEDDGPRPRSTPNRKTRTVTKHRYLWEQANGPIPKGHVLKCMDGDKTNCDPSNWRLIPQALLPRLAGRWNLAFDAAPPELKESLLRTALLQHRAAQARRKIGKLTPQERYHDRRKARAAAHMSKESRP